MTTIFTLSINKTSLRKQPSSLLLAAWNVSPGETPVRQRQKFHTDDIQINQASIWSGALIGWCGSYIVSASYCLTSDRQKATKVKYIKCDKSITKQLFSMEWNKKAFWFCWSSLADEHKTLPNSTRSRNIKTNKYAFGAPWLLDWLCKPWFTSSVWNFCCWDTDVSLSQAAWSKEKWLFSKAVTNLVYPPPTPTKFCITIVSTSPGYTCSQPNTEILKTMLQGKFWGV